MTDGCSIMEKSPHNFFSNGVVSVISWLEGKEGNHWKEFFQIEVSFECLHSVLSDKILERKRYFRRGENLPHLPYVGRHSKRVWPSWLFEILKVLWRLEVWKRISLTLTRDFDLFALYILPWNKYFGSILSYRWIQKRKLELIQFIKYIL